jgi:hypothetical protein
MLENFAHVEQIPPCKITPTFELKKQVFFSVALINEKPPFHAKSVAEVSKLFLELARGAAPAGVSYAHPIY